jgi:hypothetical protein
MRQPIYFCGMCDSSFETQREIREHYKRSHPEFNWETQRLSVANESTKKEQP